MPSTRDQATTHSRRTFLIGAGGSLAALLLPGAARSARAAVVDDSTVAQYYSRPDLSPPTIAVTTAGPSVAEGYAFVAPFTGPGQHGPLIVDNAGEPIWFRPSATLLVHDFRVQQLRGKPVLTWWEGTVDANGYWKGSCVIADTSYRVVQRLTTDFITEEHEFLITSRNTALISAINLVPTDLSPYGAAAAGTLIEGVFQEIDISSGKVLLEWHSADHVTPDESYIPAVDAWDYFHLNAIGVAEDGNLLVSARHTSTVYKVDRRTGAVIWRLGGKKNEFELGPDARFAFQHDPRAHPGGLVSLFDNGAASTDTAIEPTSRAIVLALDTGAMKATLVEAIPNPHGSLTTAMGNMQLLADGGWFVGWGTTPELSEFSHGGALRFDASFVGGAMNYRAFRSAWTGAPLGRPDVAVSGNADGTLDVFASWNGATEVSHWQFLGGSAADALGTLRTVPRSGFETTVRLKAPPRYVAAVALDAAGHKLGTSATLST
ncbi:MAG: hypothetical protein QOI27_2329 [Gaiellaceae bacterium]|jgi:hypothetical protein|nr:hypothetical protein [Gaiellaceae bacterium]